MDLLTLITNNKLKNLSLIEKKSFFKLLLIQIQETSSNFPILNFKETLYFINKLYEDELQQYITNNPKIDEFSSILCHLMNFLINISSYKYINEEIAVEIFKIICKVIVKAISKTLCFGCCLCFSNLIYTQQCHLLYLKNYICHIFKEILKMSIYDDILSNTIIHILHQAEIFKSIWDSLDLTERLLLLEILLNNLKLWKENKYKENFFIRISYVNLCLDDPDFDFNTNLNVEYHYIRMENSIISDHLICSNFIDTLLVNVSYIIDKRMNDQAFSLLGKMLECLSEASLISLYSFCLKTNANFKIILDVLKFYEKENNVENLNCFILRDGLKLVANLVYGNTELQNMVYITNSVDLILNATKLNECNPVIQQWSILALRNICENNKEISNYIKQLKLKKLDNGILS